MQITTAKPSELKTLTELTAACIIAMRQQGIDQWDEVYPLSLIHI